MYFCQYTDWLTVCVQSDAVREWPGWLGGSDPCTYRWR